MNKRSAILVAGSETSVGHSICDELIRQGYKDIVRTDKLNSDLSDRTAVMNLFKKTKPEYVFMVAGRSGGIGLNRRCPADLMLDNLLVTTNVMSIAQSCGVAKLLYLASSCVYPRDCPQPMRPDYLFTGPLEPTSEAYAMAKLAGITYCRACRRQYGSSFIVAIPSTPFGPRDSLDADNAHVIGSLMVKFCRAKLQGADKVTLWGTGTPRRDFIYEPDLGRACIWLMERYDGDDPVNITGTEPISIAQLAEKISSIAEFRGQIVFDHSYPDGAPLKCLDGSKLFSTGWRPAWDFEDALRATFEEVRRCLPC